MKKQMTFTIAMRDFFGYRPGDGLKEFSAELKALTAKDKSDFAVMLSEQGYDLTNV